MRKRKEVPSISKLLQDYRKSNDLTQSELGELLGLRKQQICDFEKRRRLASIDTALKFAKKLGEPIDEWVSPALQDQMRRVDLNYIVKLERAR